MKSSGKCILAFALAITLLLTMSGVTVLAESIAETIECVEVVTDSVPDVTPEPAPKPTSVITPDESDDADSSVSDDVPEENLIDSAAEEAENESDESQPETTLANERAERVPGGSSDLSGFLVEGTMNGVSLNEAITVVPNQDYQIFLRFQEGHGKQLKNESPLVYEYQIPNGFTANVETRTGSINAGYEGKNYKVQFTYKVENGKLILTVPEEEDVNSPEAIDAFVSNNNTWISVALKGRFTEEVSQIQWSSSITSTVTVKPTESKVSIDKRAVVNLDEKKIYYTLTVRSQGYNNDINIVDTLDGTALKIVESSIRTNPPNVGTSFDWTAKEFSYNITSLNDGETFVLTYAADIDFDKITDGGTVEQTQNSVKVTSEKDPTGDQKVINSANQIRFDLKPSKSAGRPTENNGKYTIPYTIKVNDKCQIPAGGTVISDKIADDSKKILKYSGSGITVTVRDKNNTVVRTDQVAWNQIQQGESAWSYTIPASDTEAYRYQITYTAEADTSGLVLVGDLVKVKNAFNDSRVPEFWPSAGTGISTGASKVDFVKKAVSASSTEITWELQITVPAAGLQKAVIEDTRSSIWIADKRYFDSLDENSFLYEGLLPGESMTVNKISDTSFSIKFTNNGEPGLTASADGRVVKVTYKDKVNQEWYQKADSIREKTHSNGAKFTFSDDDPPIERSAKVILDKFKISKSGTRRADLEKQFKSAYPIYQFDVTLEGASGEISLTDTFDGSILKFSDLNNKNVDLNGRKPLELMGAKESSPYWQRENFGRMTVSGDNGSLVFTHAALESTEKIVNCTFSYLLEVKDSDALKALIKMENDGPANITNTVSTEGGSSAATVSYTYEPLAKAITGQETEGLYTYVKYEIKVNPAAQDYGMDTLTVTDEFSDTLSLDYKSVHFSTEGCSFDVSGNQIKFSVPDAAAVTITYRMRVNGKPGTNVKVYNTAKLMTYTASADDLNVYVDASAAGGSSDYSIQIFKYKEGDMSTGLTGAKFQLWELDKDQKPVQQISTKKAIVTDENGWVEVSSTAFYDDESGFGGYYGLIESDAPTGYDKSDKMYVFRFSASGVAKYEDLTYVNGDTIKISNKLTDRKVKFSKTDMAGDELAGASIVVTGTDAAGRTIEPIEWVSDGKNARELELPMGSYTMTETAAPNGYEIASAIEFTVNADGTITVGQITTESADENIVTMVDDYADQNVMISKIDAAGAELAGADLKVTTKDADGNDVVVAEWTSDGTIHAIVVKPGTYTLTEDRAPLGYDVAESITFTVALDEFGDVVVTKQGVEDENGSSKVEDVDVVEMLDDYTYTEVSVTKDWEDRVVDGESRPRSITIRLFADDEDTGETLVLTAEDNWTGAFEHLQEYKEGEKIEYSVKEDHAAFYITSITGDSEFGFIVKNTFTPYDDEGLDAIKVTKKWDDKEDEAEARPDSITVKLIADGEDTGKSLELTAENNWEGGFKYLPKEKNGETIVYSVDEVEVKGYKCQISGDAVTGFTVVNKYTGPEKPTPTPTPTPAPTPTPTPTKTPTPPAPTATPRTPTSPRTGDDNNLFMWLMLLAASGTCAAAVFVTKKKRKHE